MNGFANRSARRNTGIDDETSMPDDSQDHLRSLIRTIPDFPKPGIMFRDITTLFEDPWGFKRCMDLLIDRYRYTPVDKVVAIESRGFLMGGAMAHALHCGLVVVRKKGKLPHDVERQEYELEYGTDCIEVHRTAIESGDRCLVVDDLLATGGTCEATCHLVERLGGDVISCAFIVDLPDLGGSRKLAEKYEVVSLVEFEGE